jgi:hypothetical protein
MTEKGRQGKEKERTKGKYDKERKAKNEGKRNDEVYDKLNNNSF